uniref:hypothetical protein n=1 Tax=uncultured Caulobacter sp. TaxID=158749 RepID=UPI0025D0C815|nr:hypothetical protein [uncultured Caulobacter sp.]
MSQTQTPSAWCADLQAKLMAALDAAWAIAETSDDPAVIAKARDKARLCGQMAAEVRKVAAMVPQPKPRHLPTAIHEAFDRLDAAPAPLVEAAKPPAAQAQAMQAALRKLKRR